MRCQAAAYLYAPYDCPQQDVTASATWTSGDTAIIRSNGQGVFTAVGTGDTTVFAAWQNISGGQNASVFPNTPPLPTHEIFGLVYQAGSPTPASGYINGAVIQIIDGLAAGRMTTSGGPTPPLRGYMVFDGTGRYHLLGVPPGTYHVQATKSGYISQQATVTMTAIGQLLPQVDFQLQSN